MGVSIEAYRSRIGTFCQSSVIIQGSNTPSSPTPNSRLSTSIIATVLLLFTSNFVLAGLLHSSGHVHSSGNPLSYTSATSWNPSAGSSGIISSYMSWSIPWKPPWPSPDWPTLCPYNHSSPAPRPLIDKEVGPGISFCTLLQYIFPTPLLPPLLADPAEPCRPKQSQHSSSS